MLTVVVFTTTFLLSMMAFNPRWAQRLFNGISRVVFFLPEPDADNPRLDVFCEEGTRRVARGNSRWCNRMMPFGPRHGPFVSWNDEGLMTERSHYVDGKLHGLRTVVDPLMHTSEERMYDQGQKTGVWRRYSPGSLLEETFSIEGIKNGPWRKFEFNQERRMLVEEGAFLNDRPVGRWARYRGAEPVEEWSYDEEGREHGLHTSWYEPPLDERTLKSRTTFWRGGEVWTEEWSRSGQKQREVSFNESGAVFRATVWRDDGTKEWERLPLPWAPHEEQHFLMRKWHSNGQLVVEETVVPRGQWDRREGLSSTWYVNGHPKTRAVYKGDYPEGVWTTWHENGQKASAGNKHEGKPVGHWQWWTPEGKLEREEDL